MGLPLTVAIIEPFSERHYGTMSQIANCCSAELAEVNLHNANWKFRAPRIRFLALMVLLAGCRESGSDLAPVSGRITFDGKPLEYAAVVFQVEGKSPGVAGTDKDGRYELMYKRGVKGAPIGTNRVTIVEDIERTNRPQRVPPRYNTESELRVEVKPGENNVFDFDLKSDPKSK